MRVRQDVSDAVGSTLWQIALGLMLLAAWFAAAKLLGTGLLSSPQLVAARLAQWATGDLYVNVLTTLWETTSGVLVGSATGIALGLSLGRAPVVAEVLRPLIYATYSVPLIALAPLFIMFFGLGMMPKIVLTALVVFFLMFFNTLAGAQEVDADLLSTVALIGATPWEQFRKVVAPACTAWIVGGLKVALPYALVAATTGEMLAGQHGMGFLLSDAAQKFDLTSLYAALVVLMLIGLGVAETSAQLERWLLRWRHSSE